jgi:protein-tyrosine phosphatase
LGRKRYLDAAFREIDKNMVLQMPIFKQVLGISENKRTEYIQKFTY